MTSPPYEISSGASTVVTTSSGAVVSSGSDESSVVSVSVASVVSPPVSVSVELSSLPHDAATNAKSQRNGECCD